MRDVAPLLFIPVQSGELNLPEGSHGVLIGARAALAAPLDFPADLKLVQGFRPEVLALERTGRTVHTTVPHGPFDVAFVVIGRHRGENELRLATAILHTKSGAPILVAGDKTDGVSSLRKRLQDAFPVEGRLAKHHGEVFWLRRDTRSAEWADDVQDRQSHRGLVEGRYKTASGMFSHAEVDPGSRLLADHLPADLAGRVADFCAGWGYLSAMVAERCPMVTALDLYEADFASLQAAKQNLADATIPLAFHWHDLAAERVATRYDAIVMNPPFHSGRAAEPGLGQAIIRSAHAALRAGGRLFMVANRNLPYEKTVHAIFARNERLADKSGFKVIAAWR